MDDVTENEHIDRVDKTYGGKAFKIR